jgi:RNA polymerase sigma-70 factor (ECF subfamily)
MNPDKTDIAGDEQMWLRQAQRGDTVAFTRLAEAYQGPVYHLCYRMLGSIPDAEDATQETLIRMYAKLHTYQPERKLSSWVLSIAAHYCIDRLRRNRLSVLSIDDEPMADAAPSGATQPEASALARESRDEVQALVARLAPEYRIPMLLHYWYDLSYKEIADVLDLTPQAVKTRLHRARQQLAGRAGAAARHNLTAAWVG